MSGSNIDERIVNMEFNNKQFETGAKDTMSTIDKLKKSLNFEGAQKGLKDLGEAGKNFDLSNIADGVDSLKERFSNLGVVGIAALTNITNKAVNAGLQFAKSFAVEPITDGISEYELKLGSIQTILANTARFGTQLPEVTDALNSLNAYSDKTIYNFGEMTKNVGLFTNAGINIQDATSEIKGFSNAAAASGTSAEGAAGAAYQLSQALSSGVVRLQDWKSLTNVGMGNKNMQDGIIDIAKAMGTFNENTTTAENASAHFNESLEKGWLSADVMSTYLKIMSGDMDDAAIAALGFNTEQVAAFRATQQTAQDAAQKVRTWTQLVGTLKESVGSGWAQTAEIVVGNFDEATDLFTHINDAVGGVIGKMSDARNKLLTDWKNLGGRQDLIDIGANLWNSLKNVIAPISQAWEKIFPQDPGGLKNLTGGIKIITDVIRKLTEGFLKIQPVFEVFFGIIKIGVSIIGGLWRVLINMFSIFAGAGTGGLFATVGGFAALIAKVIEFINTGKYVQKFFDAIISYQNTVIKPMIDFFQRLQAAFKLLFSGDKAGFIDGLKNSFQAFAPLIDTVQGKIKIVADWFQMLSDKIKGMGAAAPGALGILGTLLSKAAGYLTEFSTGLKSVYTLLTTGDFNGDMFGWMEDSKAVDILFRIRDALMGVRDMATGTGDALKGGVGSGMDKVSDTGEKVAGIWERISEAFKMVAAFLKPAISKVGEFFTWLSDTVQRIISNLSGEDILALINTGLFMAAYLAVKKFFDSFATLFESASGSFKAIEEVFTGLKDNLKTMQNEVKANIIMQIAIAVALLAGSIALLANIDPVSLASGIGAISILLFELIKAMEKMKESDSFKTAAATSVLMISMASALLILAAAVAIFGHMDPKTLAIGLGSIALAIGTLVAATTLMSQFAGNISVSAGLIVALSAAMLVLAGVVAIFGNMGIDKLLVGIGAMAVTLGILVGACVLLSAFAPEVTIGAGLILALGAALLLSSVGMLVGAKAVGVLADSLKKFTKIKDGWSALGLMAAALTVLTIAMAAMTSGIVGAIALTIMTAALVAFIPVLFALSKIPWDVVVRGLEVMAVVLGGIALMSLFAPGLIILGAALLVLGAGLVLSGVGLLAFATAFGIFASIGAAGIVALTATVVGMAELIPLIMQQFGLGIKALAEVLSNAGPELTAAMATLLIALSDAIIKATPSVVDAMVVLLLGLLDAINRVAPSYVATLIHLIKLGVGAILSLVPWLVDAGLRLITGLITGIDSNLQKIITAGTNLIINFITGIGNAGVRIANAAGDTIVKFLNGIADAIRSHSEQINAAGRNIAGAIIDGLTSGLSGGVGAVVAGAKKLISNIPDAMKKILNINSPSKVTTEIGEFAGEGVIVGLDNMATAVYKSAENTGNQAIEGLSNSLVNAKDILEGTDFNMNPVIRPVVDLTAVEQGVRKIDSLIPTSPTLTVDTTAAAAVDIADTRQRYQDEQVTDVSTGAPISVTFQQTNNSPQALSEIEIYRQTRNQISAATGVLKGVVTP